MAIWKLDRPTLIELVPNLEQHDIKLVPLQESIDTLTPAGKALIQIYDVFGEFRHFLIPERTQTGLPATRTNVAAKVDASRR